MIGFIDDAATEWDPALETRYRLQQTIRYAYPGTVTDLRQRLMAVPRARHGDQTRMRYDVTTSGRGARHREHIDPFGNVITDVHVDVVRDEIEFEVSSLLSRTHEGRLDVVRAWRCFASPTALTAPDDDLREAARELAGRALVGIELAEHICDWVGSTMRYEEGATAVDTTAAVAFGLRRGVCQDFAHVMVTLCRLAGMPARYVSGHLLGEGGSHAWVEVLVPDANRSRSRVAHAFDPTERDRTGSRHLTVAVGRDYADVAPMSGTYNASIPGTLTVTKRAGLANLDSPS